MIDRENTMLDKVLEDMEIELLLRNEYHIACTREYWPLIGLNEKGEEEYDILQTREDNAQ